MVDKLLTWLFVRLERPVDFTNTTRPIEVYNGNPEGTCYFAGWGPTQGELNNVHVLDSTSFEAIINIITY